MIMLPSTGSVIGLGLALASVTCFSFSPHIKATPVLIGQGDLPLDTPTHSLVGEWELTVNGVGSGVKLTFDSANVHMDDRAYPYFVEGDSLRIFTQYQDHIGDGNSHGHIAKLTDDSLVVRWREGDVNTYIRPRRPAK